MGDEMQKDLGDPIALLIKTILHSERPFLFRTMKTNPPYKRMSKKRVRSYLFGAENRYPTGERR